MLHHITIHANTLSLPKHTHKGSSSDDVGAAPLFQPSWVPCNAQTRYIKQKILKTGQNAYFSFHRLPWYMQSTYSNSLTQLKLRQDEPTAAHGEAHSRCSLFEVGVPPALEEVPEAMVMPASGVSRQEHSRLKQESNCKLQASTRLITPGSWQRPKRQSPSVNTASCEVV